ncbi:inactive tyrosine-protein kinase PEAK1-like [Acipenser ruthenus]|uniref:inactive tyrosine-protein kinase PEAK1-like n=1 Tax=Acipenser ruthenus TaxID=7906 RepID=UPI002741B468|nr:inactive tyrosine-protein kinase PEAK1-like [Acipenser ruthenus]
METADSGSRTMEDCGNLPPSLPAKLRRQRYSAGTMSSSSTGSSFGPDPEPGSPGPASPQTGPTSTTSIPASLPEETDLLASASRTYANIGQSRSSMVPPKPRMKERALSTERVPERSNRPPPLPKKLIRTHSLPVGSLIPSHCTKPPPYPAPLTPSSPGLSLNNPLYHLVGHQQRRGGFFTRGCFSSPCSPLHSSSFPDPPQVLDGPPAAPLAGLSFHTPDGELRSFFRDLHNLEQVTRGLQERLLLCLRGIAERLGEAGLQGAAQDYQLCGGGPCCQAGDALYYTVRSSAHPGRLFAAKVYKAGGESGLAIQRDLPPHSNIQRVCAHFPRGLAVVEAEEMAMLSLEPKTGGSDAPGARAQCLQPTPGDSSNENPLPMAALTLNSLAEGSVEMPAMDTANGHSPGCEVTIVDEVPDETLADYVQACAELHASQPHRYERAVCLLLLQLCEGLQHLKSNKTTHCALRMENLLLVWEERGDPGTELPKRGRPGTPRLLISNFSHAKQRTPSPAQDSDQDRLAPEMSSGSQFKKADEFQLGILIYECLHLPNPLLSAPELREGEYRPECDLPAVPNLSPYSPGLSKLAQLLLEPQPRDRVAVGEARHILQALLWGPRAELFQDNQLTPFLTLNWLEVKRCLLLLKLAEAAVEHEPGARAAPGLEERLCLQYFSFVTPQSVFQAARLLQLFHPPL